MSGQGIGRTPVEPRRSATRCWPSSSPCWSSTSNHPSIGLANFDGAARPVANLPGLPDLVPVRRGGLAQPQGGVQPHQPDGPWLHWANLAILLTTSLLPFPTAVIADAVEAGDLADVRAAVGLYALVGVLVCVSWWWFFHHLGRHPS